MLKAWLAGVCLLFGVTAKATSHQEVSTFLFSRLHPLPHTSGKLIQSYSGKNQSYIYDQALAIISFSQAGKKSEAKSLLQALAHLQLPDGSLYFSYYLDGTSPYPLEGDKRYAGAIAWVALAASHYQRAFQDKAFVSFNQKVLGYLEHQMKLTKFKGKKLRALKFAPHDIKETIWKEQETTALEHNIDAYAAFSLFVKLNPTKSWSYLKRELKETILAHWDSGRSHFWSGIDLASGTVNKSEFYLDNQTWSLLALESKELKNLDFEEALAANCDSLLVQSHNGKWGFMDSKPSRRPSSNTHVWSEGTSGQILAMKKIGMTSCQGKSTAVFMSSVKDMKKPDGGIAYSTVKSKDFSTDSSVAGTTWHFFATSNFNPFAH